jgi:signal transduction histidine kinase
MNEKRTRLFRNLPLFWKVLVPFLTLMVLVGAFGTFLIVRDLDSRAEAALDQDLSRRSLDALSTLRDRELYLLESATFAANVEGMANAIKSRKNETVGRLLQSVLALKGDLGLLSATDTNGAGLVEFTRAAPGELPSFGQGTNWSQFQFVGQAIADPAGNKSAGFVKTSDRTMLAIAAPICSTAEGCSPVGAAIVGIDVNKLVADARGKPARATPRAGSSQTGVAIYDSAGSLLAKVGPSPTEDHAPSDVAKGDVPARRTSTVDSVEIATLYSSFEVEGSRAGTLALSIPTEQALSTVRGAGVRLVLIVLLAMGGVVALGALLSRYILSQVKPLVETNRLLGQGELTARAPILGEDDLGELARGVNQMAEQLQASYETLEMRVAERTEEVQRLLKQRTEFFASLSHELRTPLAIILSEVKMMRDPTYPKQNGWADVSGRTIGDSAHQLLSLVNDILDLARAEAGSIDVNIEDLDLNKFIRELRRTIEGLAKGNGLSLKVNVPREIPKVAADRNRLREIILNLADNAVKYTPAGGKLELSASARERWVEISVSDTGVGVPPEVGDLIFEPFYRVKGTRPQRGEASTGLGLALANRLVEAQGGTLSYKSNPDSGTTFTFTLPLANIEPGDNELANDRRSVGATK